MRLCDSDPSAKLQTFIEAVEKIEPQNAENGRLSQIWKEFAIYYEQSEYDISQDYQLESEGPLENANIVYMKAS